MKALLRFILYIRETSVVTCIYLICSNNKSHPLREGVDWNIASPKTFLAKYVTLYVRVWIETTALRHTHSGYARHPLREGVDWNPQSRRLKIPLLRHPLREGVDWNSIAPEPHIKG